MNGNETSQSPEENTILAAKEDAPCNEHEDSNKNRSTDLTSNMTRDNLGQELLDHVANSKAIFKSQQKDDPELTFDEKRLIAGKLLEKSHCLFLSKFGHHLREEHLEYFSKSDDYEIAYHINRLRRYFNNSTRHIDVRNRRYQVLKKLIEKGEYFSENEMMKRNPLLYEHLIGQYLTEEEKRARDTIDINASNYVDVLMETIERDTLHRHLRSQQEEEDNIREENDSDDDGSDGKDSIDSKTVKSLKEVPRLWGGDINKRINDYDIINDQTLQSSKVPPKISKKEMQLFREEFVTNMYESFLDGKDRDFDYSTVDDNEAYDNVELRNQDEEEKYFDSEPPETVLPENECNEQDESEDELDAYMKTLKGQTNTNPHSLDNQT